jgi:sec-independent protein translocase protein TatB
MFDLFSWSHILIFVTAALLIVGPKDLPRLMHMAGRWVGKARGMADDFKRSFDDMARQSELDQLRDEIEALRKKTLDEVGSMNTALAAEMPAEAEPRSGEYQVNDTPVPVAAPEPDSHPQ